MTRARSRQRPVGSVRETRPGRFQARITIPLPDGSRTTKAKTFRDLKAARDWVLRMEAKKAEGEEIGLRDSTQPLLEWIREFYRDHRIGTGGRLIAPRTAQEDLAIVELYLGKRADVLAGTPLARVTTSALAVFFRELAERGGRDGQPLARATVERLFRVLRSRLAYAVRLGKLRRSPMVPGMIPVDGREKREQPTLTAEQARALLDVAAGDRYGAFIATLLWTGCRPGEVAGLRWSDVDLEAGRLAIRRALVRTKPNADARGKGKSWTLAPTKTRRERSMPIPAELVTVLRDHRRAQAEHRLLAGAEYEDRGLVFTTDFGRPVHLDTIAARHLKPLLPVAAAHLLGRRLPSLPPPSRKPSYREAVQARAAAEAAAMRDAGFPSISLYSCRHTVATLLLSTGTHPKIVADRLGHAKTSTTLEIYSHVTPDLQEEAVSALESSLARKARRVG